MSRTSLMNELFQESGERISDNALSGFLYELMRDHLSCGVVHGLMERSVNSPEASYTNGHLFDYADWMAEKLTGKDE